MKKISLLPTILVAALLATAAACANAQTFDPADQSGTSSTDANSSNGSSAQPAESGTSTPDSAQTQGPVRLARFSLVNGDVSWRPSSSDDWSTASANIPLREGAQIWVTNGGRAEVQFDDGSYLRLGDGAIVILQTLYSDNDGEFTELRQNQGLISLNLKNTSSVYQIDTPETSVKAAGVSKIRIGVNDGVEIAVRDGKAAISGPGGDAKLIDGNYVYLQDTSSPITIAPVPDEDSWDHWNDRRDETLVDDETDSHVPSDISVVAGDLDTYGIWREDPDYGWVWVPAVPSPDWRPYEYGSWTYCEPFGWTWVSSEPWGWAPYHYGTWFHAGYGWAWRPGPQRQYWSPAVVSFSYYNGNIGWCPLGPREVDYASLSFGFGDGAFALGFSIGEAGCYYPGDGGRCFGRPFNNYYINRYGRPGFNSGAVRTNHNPYFGGGKFIPENAKYGGLMTATSADFGTSRKYTQGGENGADYFAHGQVVGAPTSAGHAFSGPTDAHPSPTSWTATREVRTDASPNQAYLDRPVVHSALPNNVAREIPENQMRVPSNNAPTTGRSSTGAYNNDASSAAERALKARQNLGIGPSNAPVYTPDQERTNPANANVGGDTKRLPDTSGNINLGNQVRSNHVPDWNSQGSFHIDERNSSGSARWQPNSGRVPSSQAGHTGSFNRGGNTNNGNSGQSGRGGGSSNPGGGGGGRQGH